MYIRSSPRGPNRDLNWTLSNELLLYSKIYFYKLRIFKDKVVTYKVSRLKGCGLTTLVRLYILTTNTISL